MHKLKPKFELKFWVWFCSKFYNTIFDYQETLQLLNPLQAKWPMGLKSALISDFRSVMKWMWVFTSPLGWVVQSWVKFNPGLSKSYSSNCLSKEKITVLIKYCWDFPRNKLFNPKFAGQIHPCKVGNITIGWTFNPGLALIGFWATGPSSNFANNL